MTQINSRRVGTGALVLALVAVVLGSAVAGLSSYYFDAATGSSAHNVSAVQQDGPVRASDAHQSVNPTATAVSIPGAPGLMVVNLTGFTPGGKIIGSPSGTLTASAFGRATDVVSVVQLPKVYTDATTGMSATVNYATGTTSRGSTTAEVGPTAK